MSGGGEVAVRRAGADAAGLDDVEARMRAALADPGAPRWLSQVVAGVPDLECDALGPDERAARLRESFRNAGRLLSILFAEQDGRLEPVRTGRLVRVVLRTDRGAAYCLSVVPGQHVVGFLPDAAPTRADAADRVMAELADRLRADVGLRTQNPGGLAARRGTGPDPDDDEQAPAEPAAPHLTGAATGALFEQAAAALDVESVQWLGHVRDRAVVFTADRLADRRLARHFRLMSVTARRRFYGEFAADVGALAGRLARLTRGPLGGQLVRFALDVEQGSLVVHRLGAREYLVGVTVDQERVAAAERAVARLVDRHLNSVTRPL